MTGYSPAGLPHSDIPGSKPVCGSPRLFAAYRVLRRLSAPRHPPCTLSSLTKLELPLHPANPIASNPIQLSKNLEKRRAIAWEQTRRFPGNQTEGRGGQRIDLGVAALRSPVKASEDTSS